MQYSEWFRIVKDLSTSINIVVNENDSEIRQFFDNGYTPEEAVESLILESYE